jgi:hypothetical protein
MSSKSESELAEELPGVDGDSRLLASSKGAVLPLLREGALFIYGVVALLWPMLYNGFPLYVSDSAVYTTPGLRYSGVPAFYNYVISPIFNEICPWAVPVFVAALAYACLRAFIERWVARPSTLELALAITGLAFLTRISWMTSLLMPDIFAGIGLVAVLTLLQGKHPLSLERRWFLLSVLLLSMLAQTSSLLVVPLLIAFCWAVRNREKLKLESFKAVVMAWLAALIFVVANNQLLYEKTSLNPNGPAIFFAKLTDHGLAQKYLQLECARTQEPICGYLPEFEELSRTWPGQQAFLWQPVGAKKLPLADQLDAYHEGSAALRKHMSRIVRAFPLEIAAMSIHDSWSLLAAKGELFGDARPWWRHKEWTNAFLASRQQNGALIQAPFNLISQVAYGLSLVLIIALALARRTRELQSAHQGVLFVVVCNAVVHASLVGPYARYQDKVAFIPLLLLFVLLMNTDRRVRSFAGR